MEELEAFKQTILEQYPRLGAEAGFQFDCHPGVSCFNQCCADVNIFLTPYDVLRLKNHLRISSQEFLHRYTQIVADRHQQLPALQLRMTNTPEKRCHFVDPDRGCTVYDSRPWSCRMYPVGQGSPKQESPHQEGKFYFLLHEDVCKGFEQGRNWTIAGWLKDQVVDDYDIFGEKFKEIVFHDFFDQGKVLTPQKLDMFFLACYNLDRFREFLLKSSFLRRFAIPPDRLTAIKSSDEALLEFAFDWLKFSLFGEKTVTIREDVLKKVKRKAGKS